MKKLVGFLLVCLMVFSLSAVSLGASSDYVNITQELAVNHASGDFIKIDLKGTSKTKEISITEEAVNYMISKQKQLFIDMEYIQVTIDPNVIKNTAAWKNAAGNGEPLQLDMEFEVKDLDTSGKYFSDGTYNGKGLYREPASTFTWELHFLVGGVEKEQLTGLNGSIKVVSKYEWGTNWEVPTGGIPADKLRLYYFNLADANNTSIYDYVWTLVGGTVDTQNKTVTTNISKAGAYMLVGSKNHTDSSADNNNGSTENKVGSFTDITNHWAKDDINYLESIGVIKNEGDKFYPKRNITRAEFATYLVRALGLEENTSLAGKFKDVSSSKSYYNAVLTAAYYKVVNGTSTTTFSPDASITRQEMATMFMNALNVAGVSAGGNDYTKLNAFSDAGKIASWAKDGAMVAVNTGLIGGTTEKTFSPTGKTTRGEAAAMLSRFCRYINK